VRVTHTYFINSLCKFCDLIRADVWAVSKLKVNESSFANKVLISHLFSMLINQLKGPPIAAFPTPGPVLATAAPSDCIAAPDRSLTIKPAKEITLNEH
jgi:hypothetical protein